MQAQAVFIDVISKLMEHFLKSESFKIVNETSNFIISTFGE